MFSICLFMDLVVLWLPKMSLPIMLQQEKLVNVGDGSPVTGSAKKNLNLSFNVVMTML